MSSRIFLYFIPSVGDQLNIEAFVDNLQAEGLEFDDHAFISDIDFDGVPTCSSQKKLGSPINVSLSALLGNGKQIDVVCSNESILFTCGFGSPHRYAISSVSTTLRGWNQLTDESRSIYLQSFVKIAEKSNAERIIIVNDPADNFYSNVLEVDGQWVLDNRLVDGSKYEITELWSKQI